MSRRHGFDLTLACWRGLHDLEDATERAAYERGIETWRWLLLLEPWAPEALCIAALFVRTPETLEALASSGLPAGELAEVRQLFASDGDAHVADERRLLARAIACADEALTARSDMLASPGDVSGTPDSAAANHPRRDRATG